MKDMKDMKKYGLPITEQQKNALLADIKYNLFNYDARETEWNDIIVFIDRDIHPSNLQVISKVHFVCNNRHFAIYSYIMTAYHDMQGQRTPWYFMLPKRVRNMLFSKNIKAYNNSIPEMSGYTKHLCDYGRVKYESAIMYGISFFDMPQDNYFVDMDITEEEYCQVMGGLTAAIERYIMKEDLKKKEAAIELQKKLNDKLRINF